MKKLSYVVCFLAAAMLFPGCKREKKDFIGPDLSIASKNFKVTNAFQTNYNSVDFTSDSNWFNADFNERVSWTIEIRGLQSNGWKVIKGTSTSIGKQNSIWTGGHSGKYFFQAGEQVVAELSVFGSNETWSDTSSVVAEKNNYGNNTIVWWDMNQIGIARHGIDCYWFDFYDGDGTPPTVGVGERLVNKIETNPLTANDPIQNVYRAMEGKDGLGASNYYIGGCGHSPLPVPKGFSESMDNIYLNFYLRRRTTTTSLSVGLISSDPSSVTSQISYNVGEVTVEGWQLVSIRLSDMELKAGDPPFDPSRMVQFFANLQIVSAPGVDRTGFDIDFITITKGSVFDPDKY